MHARPGSLDRRVLAAVVGLFSLGALGAPAKAAPRGSEAAEAQAGENASSSRAVLVGRMPVWNVTGRREIREGAVDPALVLRLRSASRVARGPIVPAQAINMLTVDTTDDNPALMNCDDAIPGDCSLRGAVSKANSLTGGTQINVPAGTYTLTIPGGAVEGLSGNNLIGDLDVTATDVSIVGAGPDVTIIQQTQPDDRVLEINPNLDADFVFVLYGVTINGGHETTGIGGGGMISGSTGTLTVVRNCIFTGNTATGAGGGAISNIEGTLTLDTLTISGNTADGGGGAVFFDGGNNASSMTVDNSTFTNNISASPVSGGGGISISGPIDSVAVRRTHFIGNQVSSVVGGGGGAIANSSTPTGTLTAFFDRFLGNTAAVSGNGDTLSDTGGGTLMGDDNWWGVNTGPTAGDVNGVVVTRWLRLRHSANPGTISTGGSTTLTADILGRNTGGPLAVGDLNGLPAFPEPPATIFSNAMLGTLSGAAMQFTGGVAVATFTAGMTGGIGSADATADNQTVTAFITINAPPAVTTHPANQTVCVGSTATFTAAASGFPAPTVQWQVSTDGGTTFTDIPGATSTTLTFTAMLSDNGNQYRAVFTNSEGTATSNAATLTVDTPPVVTMNPSNQTVNAGQTATFMAAATGSPAPTVQWQVSTDGGVTFTDIPGATSTTLSFTASPSDSGHQYRAVFTNTCGTATTSAATLTVNVPPSVTTNPTNQTVCAGSTATFTAAASGFPTPTVQWQVSTNGGGTFTDIPGATSTTLSFTAAASDNGNLYRAVFTNAAGSATTSAATLTVDTAPVVTMNPSNQTVNAGQTATFMAAASGSPTPTVQWQVSTNGGATFTDIPGATSTTLSFTAAASDDGHQYRAVFTNSCGTATTTAATLTVHTAPSVTTHPSNQTACAGGTATFTAAASGNPTPTVQWQVSTDGGTTFTDIPGATSTTLSFTAAISDNGNQYRAVFTNVAGTATTNAATLTVDTAPTVTTNPTNQAVLSGQTATFTAAASGSPTPTVQWQVSTDGGVTFTNIPGATSTTLSFTATAADNGHQYRAVFTNTCGTATTTAATLSVDTPMAVVSGDATICPGRTATIRADFTGPGPVNITWSDGFVQNNVPASPALRDVSPAVTTTYTITSISNANGPGSASGSATITVNPACASYYTVTPCRVVNTRTAQAPALGANTTRSFQVTGLCNVPSGAKAVAVVVTAVGETDFGDLRLFATGTPPPVASVINFAANHVRAGNGLVTLGTGGQISVQCDMPPGSTGITHFLMDVVGYFK